MSTDAESAEPGETQIRVTIYKPARAGALVNAIIQAYKSESPRSNRTITIQSVGTSQINETLKTHSKKGQTPTQKP